MVGGPRGPMPCPMPKCMQKCRQVLGRSAAEPKPEVRDLLNSMKRAEMQPSPLNRCTDHPLGQVSPCRIWSSWWRGARLPDILG